MLTIKTEDAKPLLEMLWAMGMPKTCRKATLYLKVHDVVEMECTFFPKSGDNTNLADKAGDVVKRYQLVEKPSDAKEADSN